MSKINLFLSVALLAACGCNAMQKNATSFFVREGALLHAVEKYNVSPFLRSLNPKQLEQYASLGNRIKTIKLSDGSFRLQEQGGLMGGGPILGCVTAIVGYTSVGIAALGTLIATLPVAGPGAVAAAGVVASSGVAAVTYGVIAATASPTP